MADSVLNYNLLINAKAGSSETPLEIDQENSAGTVLHGTIAR